MRAIEWMGIYNKKYDDFLNTGNSVTDNCKSILLHSEGNGTELPKLFAVENAEEIVKRRREEEETKKMESISPTPNSGVVGGMPPMPGAVPPQPPVASPVQAP